MTKLKLNLAQGAGEILTREELKGVLGGTGSGGGDGSGDGNCNWYWCVCSQPLSVVIIKNSTSLQQGSDIVSVTRSLSEGDCKMYNSVTCTYDKPC